MKQEYVYLNTQKITYVQVTCYSIVYNRKNRKIKGYHQYKLISIQRFNVRSYRKKILKEAQEKERKRREPNVLICLEWLPNVLLGTKKVLKKKKKSNAFSILSLALILLKIIKYMCACIYINFLWKNTIRN